VLTAQFILAHIEHNIVNNWNKQGILRTTKDSNWNWTYANYNQPNNQKPLTEAYARYNRLNSNQIVIHIGIVETGIDEIELHSSYLHI
jgi:hypothetical protein